VRWSPKDGQPTPILAATLSKRAELEAPAPSFVLRESERERKQRNERQT
jgi:hypothetical protein